MNTTADTTVEVRRTFAATPERCFRAFTDPDALRAWYAPVDGWIVTVAEVDAREGGTAHIEFGPASGAIIVEDWTFEEFSPSDRIVYTLDLTARGGGSERTRVTVDFRAVDGGTEVSFKEEGYSSRESRDHHARGIAHMFSRFEAALR